MFKLLFLLVGLGLGFGTGVYWGVHHPAQASQLADEEEQRFIELQIKTSEAIKQKLDQIASKQQPQQAAAAPAKPFAPSGFVSARTSAAAPDPDVAALRQQQDEQIQQLHQRLAQLKSK